MTKDYSTCFKEGFGFDIPIEVSSIIALIPDMSIQVKLPGKPFTLEIQYLPVPSVSLCDTDKMLFCFAIDSDGYEIYVDISNTKYEVRFESSMEDRFDLSICDLAAGLSSE
jgi:hypothetical protein